MGRAKHRSRHDATPLEEAPSGTFLAGGLPEWSRSLLPPWRTSEGRPLPVGTALLVVLLFASRRHTKKAAVSKKGADDDGKVRHGREKSTRSERIAYRIDNFFSTKSYASAVLMLAITTVLVVLGGGAHWLAAGGEGSIMSSMWLAWRFVTDGGDYDDDIAPRIVGLVLVLSGMLFFALLVGLIGESIENRLDELKQGKNRVIETGHTLVLGWSDKFIELAREVAKSKASEGGGVIVVLSDKHEKSWMDEFVAEELPQEEMEGTQVVCRTGDPVSLADLQKVSAADAASIVVLADYALEPDMSDARAVRCVLALRAGIATSAQTLVELRDIDNRPTLEMVAETGDAYQADDATGGGATGGGGAAADADAGHADGAPGIVQAVVPHDIIGRLMIQCARQNDLAEVYDALCGFDGMEFYFKAWPSLAGRRWGDVAFSFAEAMPIGVRRPGHVPLPSAAHGGPEGPLSVRWGGIVLNPSDNWVLHEEDEVLVVAEDDDTYSPSEVPNRPEPGLPPSWRPPPRPNENVLLLGWRRDLFDMLHELDKYVAKGSIVTVLAPVPLEERTSLLEQGKERGLQLHNISLRHVCGSTILRRDIESVMRSCVFSSVLVLASEGPQGLPQGLSAVQQASASDSRALTTLLLVRDIRRALLATDAVKPKTPPAEFTLLGEILDSETKDLVAAAGVSNYILSNRLMSKVMAMVSESASIGPLFEQLFSEEGDEIHVRDCRIYALEGETLSFWEMCARARAVGDVALGFKRRGGGVELNPPNKDEKLLWQLGDQLVVIGDELR